MLGQNGTSFGQNGEDTEQNGILQQTHAQVIYWECFDEFTSARLVLRVLGMPNFNASMVVRMNNDLNESQINLVGLLAHNVPFYSKVSTKW